MGRQHFPGFTHTTDGPQSHPTACADTCTRFQKETNCLQPTTCESATQFSTRPLCRPIPCAFANKLNSHCGTNTLATLATNICMMPVKQTRGCHLSNQQPPFLMLVQHASEPSRPRRNNNTPQPAESLPPPNLSHTTPKRPCSHARDHPLISSSLVCTLLTLNTKKTAKA